MIDIAKAIQGIFLFNTDSLETLAKNIEIFFFSIEQKRYESKYY